MVRSVGLLTISFLSLMIVGCATSYSKKWRYYGRTSGMQEIYEVYRIPNDGKAFHDTDLTKYPERLLRDGSWRHDNKPLMLEFLTGEFSPSTDEITEAEVERLRELWARTRWPGRD